MFGKALCSLIALILFQAVRAADPVYTLSAADLSKNSFFLNSQALSDSHWSSFGGWLQGQPVDQSSSRKLLKQYCYTIALPSYVYSLLYARNSQSRILIQLNSTREINESNFPGRSIYPTDTDPRSVWQKNNLMLSNKHAVGYEIGHDVLLIGADGEGSNPPAIQFYASEKSSSLPAIKVNTVPNELFSGIYLMDSGASKPIKLQCAHLTLPLQWQEQKVQLLIDLSKKQIKLIPLNTAQTVNKIIRQIETPVILAGFSFQQNMAVAMINIENIAQSKWVSWLTPTEQLTKRLDAYQNAFILVRQHESAFLYGMTEQGQITQQQLGFEVEFEQDTLSMETDYLLPENSSGTSYNQANSDISPTDISPTDISPTENNVTEKIVTTGQKKRASPPAFYIVISDPDDDQPSPPKKPHINKTRQISDVPLSQIAPLIRHAYQLPSSISSLQQAVTGIDIDLQSVQVTSRIALKRSCSHIAHHFSEYNMLGLIQLCDVLSEKRLKNKGESAQDALTCRVIDTQLQSYDDWIRSLLFCLFRRSPGHTEEQEHPFESISVLEPYLVYILLYRIFSHTGQLSWFMDLHPKIRQQCRQTSAQRHKKFIRSQEGMSEDD